MKSEGDIIQKQGKIIKGIAGFYYVLAEEKLYECKAKGVFRNKSIKPLVGDNVAIDVIDDQAMIVFALKQPNPNLNLLDKFLVMMEFQNIETIICFNKKDIADETFMEQLKTIYNNAGYRVIFASATEDEGVETVK